MRLTAACIGAFQTYVKLCSSIIFATLLNLPGAAAAVSAAGYDQELFKRLVDALHKVRDDAK